MDIVTVVVIDSLAVNCQCQLQLKYISECVQLKYISTYRYVLFLVCRVRLSLMGEAIYLSIMVK